MFAISKLLSVKVLSVAAIVGGLGFSAVPSQAAPVTVQTVGFHDDYEHHHHHHHREIRISARSLHMLGHKIREARERGYEPVGRPHFDGYDFVQVMVR